MPVTPRAPKPTFPVRPYPVPPPASSLANPTVRVDADAARHPAVVDRNPADLRRGGNGHACECDQHRRSAPTVDHADHPP